MNINSKLILTISIVSGFLSACSHQQVAPIAPVVHTPIVEQPKTVHVPAPRPYKDVVVAPAPLKPAPLPAPVVVKPRPAPVIVAQPKPIKLPPVKAKGNYRGSVPIDERLRQQYQQ